MTSESALEIFNRENVYQKTSVQFDMAVEVAKKALKKDIAMKPTTIREFDGDTFAECPNCSGSMLIGKWYGVPKRCNKCGQKLDWSDENA